MVSLADRDVDRARAALEAASKHLDEAGGAVIQAEIAYDEDASDVAFASLETALSSQRRAQLDLTRAERRLEEAETAFAEAIKGERRGELGELKFALTSDERRARYDVWISQIIPLAAQLEDLVSSLGAENVQLLVKHDRARDLARFVGDIGFAAQVPRPDPQEAISLLRLLIGSHTQGVAHEALVPWDRPAWNSPGMPIYEQAQSLLEGDERLS